MFPIIHVFSCFQSFYIMAVLDNSNGKVLKNMDLTRVWVLVEGRGSRVEGRGSRVEGRGSRVEGRGSNRKP